MADTFTTITSLINSPPGQLVAGGVLAGVIWKCFEKVESVLTDNTKLEIAVWLVGLADYTAPDWPHTFMAMFDRVFGYRHITWKCFLRSCMASYSAVFIVALFDSILTHHWYLFDSGLSDLVKFAIIANLIPDYFTLLETRLLLPFMKVSRSTLRSVSVLVLNAALTAAIGIVAALFARNLGVRSAIPPEMESLVGRTTVLEEFRTTIEYLVLAPKLSLRLLFSSGDRVFFFAAFFTSIWLWLYFASGFLLKSARRFDIGFQWFTSKVDIEKKPLSAIGLVAGALVAVLWWTVVVVRWIV